MTKPLACPHCDAAVFRASQDGSRVKARTSILVLHKSGEVEINCSSCGGGVFVPLTAVAGDLMLKKAEAKQRFVIRKHRT